MKTLLVILIVLFPLASLAGNWGSCTPTIDQTANPHLRPDSSICFEPDATSLDSPILRTNECSDFDVIYEPDQSGAGVAISCDVMSCVRCDAASTNYCDAIGGVTLAGVPPNTELYGAAAECIYLDCSGTIGSETPRVLVHCNN